MTDVRKGSTPAWEHLVSDLVDENTDVARAAMFGMPCLKIGGKAFAGSYDGGAVFKLPEPARSEALALAGAELFDPSGQRPMKEWVVVPPAYAARWPALVRVACAYLAPR